MFRQRPSAELSHAALRAMHFARLARQLVGGDAKFSSAADPAFYEKLTAGLAAITDEAIERAALPFFQRQLSQVEAQAALSFFASPIGSAIAAKLVDEDSTNLTEAEEAAFTQFKGSSNGIAVERFLGDPLVMPAIAEEVVNHAP